MGMSGEEYDRYSGDFTPNKDRRMAEWRKKKEQEKRDRGAKQAREDAAREAEKEESKEMTGPAEPTKGPEDNSILDSIINGQMGAPAVKPQRRNRRKHFDSGHQPTLFDEVE